MNLVLAALAMFVAGGAGALLKRRTSKTSTLLGQTGAVCGAALGLAGSVYGWINAAPAEAMRLPWSVPFGSFSIEVDALSAFFLLPIFLLTGLAAVYGGRYLSDPKYDARRGGHWAFFNLLAASMVMVVIARNAMLFLIAWEIMALASYFLVTLEHERESVRHAGWTYLVSTHLGTMFLFFFFILLGSRAGSLDFDAFAASGTQIHPQAGLLFILALIGFGSKAGIVPLHVWLPEAHPAAPSHVSALMSGVMIKTGIYGIIRALLWLGTPPAGWALALISIGCVSGVLGILLASAQKDLKRVLAYSSVENVGIVFLGLGVGILGQATGMPALTMLGYAGALLHILNHALFKGLLFLGAGSVLHGARTLDMERTGGLLKRMPWTGVTFLVGAVAISGLPPLNGFVGEFMIYAGAFQGIQSLDSVGAAPAIIAIVALALIGGLAAVCFTRVFGIVFLGEPRSTEAAQAHESKAEMRWPMVVLAALCILIGISAPLAVAELRPVLQQITQRPVANLTAGFAVHALSPLSVIVGVSFVFAALVAGLVWLRKSLINGRSRADVVTWDCGYTAPSSRMQYTATSFAQPLIQLSAGVVRLRQRLKQPQGYFPASGSLSTEAPDVVERTGWAPVFKGANWLLSLFRWIQTGSIHLYILYIAITLIVLLIWKLR